MNRQQALAWLVENVTKWPVKKKKLPAICDGWHWLIVFNGDIFAANLKTREAITQQDWLDATGTL